MSLDNIGPVVLAGAGKMGLALARGWIAAGLKPSNLVLVDPNPGEHTITFAIKTGARLVPSAEGVSPRVLVLAVKPQIIGDVMAQLRPVVGAETLVVSIAAGISIAAIAQGLGTHRIVRTMPNTPAQIGKGVTGAVSGPGVEASDRAVAADLLQAAGQVAWFDDEKAIDAVTAVSGSGPAYVFNLVEALAAAGVRQGLPAEQAMLLARQTIVGAAYLLEAEPDIPASTLRENVTSPKGTTAAALEVLMGADGFGPVLDRAVEAARRRSEELGRG
ncbi:pyrroline-5-carboxylate reductase [Paradevosia shaoguanensis]|uniref:pyrroline-5-carboxylate reductase n=1 Tax=Paradevosia shaoguanensis TaxID=1335043 RepID=UPI003C71C1BE